MSYPSALRTPEVGPTQHVSPSLTDTFMRQLAQDAAHRIPAVVQDALRHLLHLPGSRALHHDVQAGLALDRVPNRLTILHAGSRG